jgi:hypothetical protein
MLFTIFTKKNHDAWRFRCRRKSRNAYLNVVTEEHLFMGRDVKVITNRGHTIWFPLKGRVKVKMGDGKILKDVYEYYENINQKIRRVK